MTRLWIVALSIITLVSGQIVWQNRARLKDPQGYMMNIIQETIYELEKKEWCNLKLLDISQTLNEQMYDWLVAGTVNYTNGFVVSIQNIDVSNTISFDFGSRTVDNVTTTTASVRGFVNLNDVEIGFDVVVDLNDELEKQYYTGAYTYVKIQMEILITKNLHLNSITTGIRVTAVTNGGRHMVYIPANSLTEVLSRSYFPAEIWDGVRVWASDIINPIVFELAEGTQFPEVCFNTC